MKIKTNNEAGKERIILLGMILSKRFLKTISLFFDSNKNYFATEHTKIVAKWAWEYWQKYQKPCSDNLKNIFESEKEKIPEGSAELVEQFLVGISDEYQRAGKFNVRYAIDIAEEYFRYQAISNLKIGLEKKLAVKNLEGAEDLISSHTSNVSMQENGWINPFSKTQIKNVFATEESDLLMRMHGAFGEMIGDIEREFLIGILGKTGIGKTWLLLFFAMSALYKGYNVVFVNLELSDKQLMKRIYHYITGLPAEKNEGEILVPVFDCKLNQNNTCRRSERTCNVGLSLSGNKLPDFNSSPENYKTCKVCRKKDRQAYSVATWFEKIRRKAINQTKVVRRVNNLLSCNFTRGGKLRIISCPSGTLTVTELKRKIKQLINTEGFIPDMIVTDYADKFKGEKGSERFEIKGIWEGHKALGQEFHACVVTASQSSAARSGRDTKHYDWAEASFKKDLIDIGVTLNQKEAEKQACVLRVSLAKHRHEYFSHKRQVILLQALNLGRPYLDSEKF